MEELLPGLVPKLEMAAQVLGSLVVIATVLAKMISGGKYEDKVGKISGVILKIIGYLPTLGVNPQTKKLEDAYKALKKSEGAAPPPEG